MAITATDLQEMITHWLGCRTNGYLGSGYGSSIPDLLHTPLTGPGADAQLRKLRDDIAVMAQLGPDQLNIYAEPAGVDRLNLYFEVAGNFIQVDATAPFVRSPTASVATVAPPVPAGDPFDAQVALLMKFNDSLTDTKGHGFGLDGAISYVSNGSTGRSVSIGGATTGLGGGNVIYSALGSLDWAAQGDICIEVVGRINSNISRQRTFIRLAQGAADIAYIGADTSGAPALLAGFATASNSIASFGGIPVAYGTSYHLCLQRIGNSVKFYIGGVQSGVTSTNSYFPPNAATDIYIGNSQRSFVDAMDGEIDWVRITNAARYTGPFTAPVEP